MADALRVTGDSYGGYSDEGGGNVVVAHGTVEWNSDTSQYDVTSFDGVFSELWESINCVVEVSEAGVIDRYFLPLRSKKPAVHSPDFDQGASIQFAALIDAEYLSFNVYDGADPWYYRQTVTVT